MSKADDNQPDFNDFDLPGDEDQLENLDLPDAADPMADFGSLDLPSGDEPQVIDDAASGPEEVTPLGDEAPEAEEAAEEEEAPTAGKKKGKKSKKPKKEKKPKAKKEKKPKPKRTAVEGEGMGMAGMATFGFCGLSLLVLVAMDIMVFKNWGLVFMLFMNGFWLIGTAVPFIMWMGREKLNFYEVMLGLVVVAIVVALSLFLGELASYDGEFTTKGVSASTVQLGSTNTNALA